MTIRLDASPPENCNFLMHWQTAIKPLKMATLMDLLPSKKEFPCS